MNTDILKPAPDIAAVTAIAGRHFPRILSAERVPQGCSTYVYRILTQTTGESDIPQTRYMRFLPEDASFGAEVLAHRTALSHGILVPQVLLYEDRNPETGLSLMITEEIPGQNVADAAPDRVLREAGRQLAKLHRIPVSGFGWIDRAIPDRLCGEHKTFRSFFLQYLEEDLKALDHYPLIEKSAVAQYMDEALSLLDVSQACLVHGDFDTSHIFHENGHFTGFINFGEIRGCHPFFDLGTLLWADDTPDRIQYRLVCAGSSQITPLSTKDHQRIALIGLYQLLRFLNRKKNTPMKEFWNQKTLRHLEWMR